MDNKGFTIVELMVVLALIGIMYALVTPMARLYQNDSAANLITEFVTNTRIARSQAITSTAPVTMCQMTQADQQSAEPECSADTSWEEGWVIFADTNGDGTITNGTPGNTADDDTIIRFHTALPPSFTLRSGATTRITFQNTGMTTNGLDTWTLCDPSKNLKIARAAIVRITGQARLAEDTDSPPDNIRNGGDGNNLACPT